MTMRCGVFRMAALAAVILTAGLSPAVEGDSVLYWMVDDTAQVTKGDGTTVGLGAYLSEAATALGFVEDDDHYFAARIHVTGGTPSVDTYLPIYYPGDGSIEDGTLGVAIGDSGSGYWGAGVPTGSQSPVGDYAAGTPEYSFIVEIGSVTWDGDQGSWLTVAEGASAAYSSLHDYIHTSFDMNPESTAVWRETAFTAVPEPSSALLFIVGGALLMLRRRGSER